MKSTGWPEDRADGVIRVVVAIRAGKLDHAEFHVLILTHLERELPRDKMLAAGF